MEYSDDGISATSRPIRSESVAKILDMLEELALSKPLPLVEYPKTKLPSAAAHLSLVSSPEDLTNLVPSKQTSSEGIRELMHYLSSRFGR